MSDEEHGLPDTFKLLPRRGSIAPCMGTAECKCGLPFIAIGASESRVMGRLLKELRAHLRHPDKVPRGWERVPLKGEEKE